MTIKFCLSVKNGNSESHVHGDQTADERTPVPWIGDRISDFQS